MYRECEICDQPATRMIRDVDDIPDKTFWRMEVEAHDPPWHFCIEHAEGHGEPWPVILPRLPRPIQISFIAGQRLGFILSKSGVASAGNPRRCDRLPKEARVDLHN